MVKATRSKSRRKESGATKDAILDAAEQIFSERGYHGAAVRDIFSEANVNSGLMSYYFESKEDLFSQAIIRRLPELRTKFEKALSQDLQHAARPMSPEDLLGRYIRFFVESAFGEDRSLRHYIHLLANSASVYDDELVARLLKNFDFITDRMLAELADALPFADKQSLREGMFYLESAVTTMLLTDRFREARLGTANAAALGEVISHMASFFTAGFLSAVTLTMRFQGRPDDVAQVCK